MHMTLQIPYVYDFIIKLWMQHAQVIQTHETALLEMGNPTQKVKEA
jgi:hypothetical protein